MLRVLVVVGVRHEPFVHAEDAAGLQHTENLRVHAFERGGVHSGFDSVDSVEAVRGKRHLLLKWLGVKVGRRDVLEGIIYHEVTFLKAEFVRKPLSCSIGRCAIDLVVIIVQPHNVDASELYNLPSWSSNTTTDV